MRKNNRMLVLSALCLLWASPASALPYNARQIEGGYWVGGRPAAEDAEELRELGITKVVSIVKPKKAAREALREAGIRRVPLPFGSKFPTLERLEKALGDTPPEQVYIHCRYGADRVAVVAAFLLATEQGWSIPEAFLAVVYTNTKRGQDDEAELRALLEEEGFDTSDVDEDVPGVFSPWKNGGDGGLKIRHENYKRMVRKTIARIREANQEESP